MGIDYKFPEEDEVLLGTYREFAVLNEGFVNIKSTSDLKLPDSLKKPSKEELETIKTTIEKVVSTGNCDLLFDIRGLIF